MPSTPSPRIASRSSGSGIPARRPPSWPRCPWSSWPGRIWPSRPATSPPADHRSAWLEHLEDILLSLAHIASVDAFQTWIYTSGEGQRCRGARRRLAPHPRALRARAWTGAVSSRSGSPAGTASCTSSMYPFYYIEYGIAQIGALQVWRNSLQRSDPAPSAPYRERPGARRGARPAGDVPRGRRPAHLRREKIGAAGASWSRPRSSGSGPSCRA